MEEKKRMTDLSPQEQRIVEALKTLGANAPEKLKTADHVMDVSKLPKGIVGNVLTALCNKGFVKRVAREKAAGYYLLKEA